MNTFWNRMHMNGDVICMVGAKKIAASVIYIMVRI